MHRPQTQTSFIALAVGILATGLLTVVLSSCACTTCEQDNGNCPDGTTLEGAEPPDGYELWCEKDGRKEGPYTKWHRSGGKAENGQYKSGMKDGRWTGWYEGGQVEWEAEFSQDEKDGEWTRFYEDGTQASAGTYDDGKMTGKWIRWHKNGKKSEEGTMKEGQNHGKWKFYDRLGRLKRTEEYDRGAKKTATDVDPGGDKEVVIADTNKGRKDPRCPKGAKMFGAGPPAGVKEWCENGGIKHGPYIEYWDTGERLISGQYDEGTKSGTWTEFYKNGNKTSSGSFENNRKTGKWTFWYIDGQIREEGEYVEGKKSGTWNEYTTTGLKTTKEY